MNEDGDDGGGSQESRAGGEIDLGVGGRARRRFAGKALARGWCK
jgi:hypothetical protein